MNSIYSEQQLKDLKALFYIRPMIVGTEAPASLCGCCGSNGSYTANVLTPLHNGRITHSVGLPGTVFNIREGCDGLVIPDAACNVVLEWEKQP